MAMLPGGVGAASDVLMAKRPGWLGEVGAASTLGMPIWRWWLWQVGAHGHVAMANVVFGTLVMVACDCGR